MNAAIRPRREVGIKDAILTYGELQNCNAKINIVMKIARAVVAASLLALAPGSNAYAQGPARKLGLAQLLNRIAQQADAFRKTAPDVVAEETLAQKTRQFDKAGKVRYVTHEVVSEYAFAGLPDAPTVIHEIRKVISVDGKQVTSIAKARQMMRNGLKAGDDALKKSLLEDFEKHGLHGAVTDFGQVILLFSARHQKEYEFEPGEERVVGTDRVLVLKYKQVAGKGGVTVFRGKGEEKTALEGELLVRETDGMPLRVTMSAIHSSQDGDTKDTLQVDYTDSGIGCVVPATVLHQEYFKDELMTENLFRYSPFRRIGDDAK